MKVLLLSINGLSCLILGSFEIDPCLMELHNQDLMSEYSVENSSCIA